jgi:hypothetical protein
VKDVPDQSVNDVPGRSTARGYAPFWGFWRSRNQSAPGEARDALHPIGKLATSLMLLSLV